MYLALRCLGVVNYRCNATKASGDMVMPCTRLFGVRPVSASDSKLAALNMVPADVFVIRQLAACFTSARCVHVGHLYGAMGGAKDPTYSSKCLLGSWTQGSPEVVHTLMFREVGCRMTQAHLDHVCVCLVVAPRSPGVHCSAQLRMWVVATLGRIVLHEACPPSNGASDRRVVSASGNARDPRRLRKGRSQQVLTEAGP